ncbi:MAG: protease inhibitor I42 family protein [Clostridiales bacterium]|nr:protease inhibitor I42 family protein [Clostridiales bacterium]
MKRLVYLAVCFLLYFLTACAESGSDREEASYTVEGEHFSAQVINGGELILDLPSNATTGYTWVITREPDCFASDYDTYIESGNDDRLVGVGGISEFHIIVLKDGEGTMEFQYKRNWEGGETAGTYELTLTISDLQIKSVSFEQVE